MTAKAAVGPAGNPFCTRHVRPGRLPFLDGTGRPVDLSGLLAKLATVGFSAALVGPHGSGKTTLLGHLAEALEAEGRHVRRLRIGHPRDAVRLLAVVARARRGDVVCVDGWERLGLPWRPLVRWCAAARHAGLVVTAHRVGALPTLWACEATPAVLGAIVARLTDGADGPPAVVESDLGQAFRGAEGDIREALFRLYDVFETRARAARNATA